MGDAQAINAGLALSAYSRLALVESDIPQKARIQGHLEQAVLDLCLGQQMDIKQMDQREVLKAAESAAGELKRLALPASWETVFSGLGDFVVKRTA